MQAAFMAAACRCAVAAGEASKVTGRPEAYRRWMKEAESSAIAMEAALASACSGRFADWYAPEEIFDLKETRAMIERRVKGMVPQVDPKKLPP